jgi:flagellar motor switch protein FliN/FliY
MENIDLILDIQLRLSARLGQVEMQIGEIMKLTPGSVIDIDRLVDEPIELVVNDRPIARGEIVVVQENFGIKITEIISQKERIRSLT